MTRATYCASMATLLILTLCGATVHSNPVNLRCCHKRLGNTLKRIEKNYLRDHSQRSDATNDHFRAAASRLASPTCAGTVDAGRDLRGELSVLVAHCRDEEVGRHVDDAFERDLRMAEARLADFLFEVSDLVSVFFSFANR